MIRNREICQTELHAQCGDALKKCIFLPERYSDSGDADPVEFFF